MKIRKITLKDVEYKEIEDGFEPVFTNEKNYPAFLTNYALKKGKENGLIKSSLFSDLLQFSNVEKEGEVDPSIFENISEAQMLQTIYLAFVGANKSTELTIDDFLEKYHAPLDETIELYMNLIMDAVSSDPNKFADELKKSTSTSRKNGKK